MVFTALSKSLEFSVYYRLLIKISKPPQFGVHSLVYIVYISRPPQFGVHSLVTI